MQRFLRKVFKTVVFFIGLIALMEICFRLLKIPKISHFKNNLKAQELMPQIDEHTILIIGDSRLEWGIDPSTMLKGFSKDSIKVIDIAMPGHNGLDVLYYLLHEHIYPKVIIGGYAPNYGLYKKHDYERVEFSLKNKLLERLNYNLDQTFYFRDRSLMEHLSQNKLYFKSHKYDLFGGAIINEYGSYSERAKGQLEMFKDVKRNLTIDSLNKYFKEMSSVVEIFKSKGTIFCGLYMPVSKDIFDLQNVDGGPSFIPINYNKFYNLSKITYEFEKPDHDSVFFYDGCHLNHEYAIIFTKKIVDSLKNDFGDYKK